MSASTSAPGDESEEEMRRCEKKVREDKAPLKRASKKPKLIAKTYAEPVAGFLLPSYHPFTKDEVVKVRKRFRSQVDLFALHNGGPGGHELDIMTDLSVQAHEYAFLGDPLAHWISNIADELQHREVSLQTSPGESYYDLVVEKAKSLNVLAELLGNSVEESRNPVADRVQVLVFNKRRALNRAAVKGSETRLRRWNQVEDAKLDQDAAQEQEQEQEAARADTVRRQQRERADAVRRHCEEAERADAEEKKKQEMAKQHREEDERAEAMVNLYCSVSRRKTVEEHLPLVDKQRMEQMDWEPRDDLDFSMRSLPRKPCVICTVTECSPLCHNQPEVVQIRTTEFQRSLKAMADREHVRATRRQCRVWSLVDAVTKDQIFLKTNETRAWSERDTLLRNMVALDKAKFLVQTEAWMKLALQLNDMYKRGVTRLAELDILSTNETAQVNKAQTVAAELQERINRALGDDDLECTGTKTLEQKNRALLANAIDLT